LAGTEDERARPCRGIHTISSLLAACCACGVDIPSSANGGHGLSRPGSPRSRVRSPGLSSVP
jgi:hypothetical protein